MGTVPGNFPPEARMEIGTPILTGVSSGNTGPFPATVFFTVPTTGLYSLLALLHVTQTDGLGTLGLSINVPRFPPVSLTGPVTNDLASETGVGMFAAGTQIPVSASASSLANTTFNVYLCVVRVF